MDMGTPTERFERGLEPPWMYRVLGKEREAVYHYLFVHQGLLADEPVRRAYVEKALRDEVERTWQEAYPHLRHGRIYFHIGRDGAEDLRNAVTFCAILLPEGRHPRAYEDDHAQTPVVAAAPGEQQ
jgi:hypothetical protein